VPIDGGYDGDRPAAAGDDDVGTSLDAVEVLAEPVVQLADADVIASARM
jgi:hypothetical protein